MSEEEVKSTLEKIAYTGMFWHDWEKLKVALSCWLKKVLSEYPEAKMTDELQKEALGESYSELVRRLDEALLSFDEGPPFTLQRLCEILVAARSIYPKLSKLALALEKNLLVTSMLSIRTEAEVQLVADEKAASESRKLEEATKEDIKTAAANEHRKTEAGNGIGAMEGDTDEIMTDVVEEAAEVDDAMTIDTQTFGEPSEETMTTSTTTKTESETATEIIAEEPSSDPMAADEGDLPLP